MPDIFDQAATEAEPDVFDQAVAETDVFDQAAAEITTGPQPVSELSSRALADSAGGTARAITMATRVFAKTPMGKLADFVAGKTGGVSSEEFITEVEGMGARARDDYGVDPKFDKTTLSAVASGVGSLLPIAASGALAPLTGGLMQAESTFQESTQAGVTGPKRAVAAGLAGATAAATEMLLGLPKLLKIFKAGAKVPLNTMRQKVASVLKGGAKTGVFESVQEGTEKVLTDWIAKGFYDPDRKWFDWDGIKKSMVAGAVVGTGFGGVMQTAFNASSPKSTGVINPKAVAPKEQMQDAAQSVDESLAQLAMEEPPPLPTEPAAAPATEVLPATEAPVVQPTTTAPTPAAEPSAQWEFLGAAINTPEGIVTGESNQAAHLEIMMDAAMQGRDIGAKKEDQGFAFRKPDGEIEFVDRVEAARRLSDAGMVQGLEPGTRLLSEHVRGLVKGVTFNPNPNVQETKTPTKEEATERAARELQQYRDQAIDAARKAGATDPELAGSIAQQQSAEKGIVDPALFIETARRRGLDQARAAKPTISAEEAPEASVERGPRAEAVSEEDIQSIEGKVASLPEVQRNIIRELENDPDLTDQEVGSLLNLTVDQVKKAKAAFRKTMREFIAAQGIGARLGPGAANVEEALAQYEVRKFGKRFQESEDIAPEVKAATGNRFYEIIPNRVTAERATEIIEKNGEENAEEQIRDESSTLSYADRSTVGQILIKRYNDQYKSLKNTNPEEASKVLDKASNLAEWASDFGTRLGQGVQSFAMWMRLTPEGKLRTFQKMVRKKRDQFTRDNRNDIDEIKDVANGEGTPEQKAEKLRNPTAKKVRKKAKDLVKDGPLTDEKFHTLTASELGLPVFDADTQKEILRLAEIADQAPEGMPKMEATLELNKFIARQKGFEPSDLLFGIYYGNILSGGWTQAVNLIDTALNVQNEVAVLAIQNPKAAAEIASAMARGASMGKYDALMAVMKGRRISDGKFVEDPFFMEIAEFGKKGGVPIKQDTRIGRAAKAITESPIGAPLRAYKYVGRLMSASDALSFRSAQEAKAAQLAFKIANDNDSTVDQVLGYDRLPEFRQQAKSEGYTGAQAEARANELMIMSRPAELQKAAADFASDSTYNVRPYGLMGGISNSIESLTRDYKVGKLVVPFTRIVANVVNRGMNNSPYGYVNALRGKAGVGRSQRVFSPEERNAMMVRATVATSLMATMVALHESGALTIHGAGPSDPEKKKQLRQTGWKPYTVQIGDKFYSYNYTPWGLMMAATGNWLDNAKYKDFSSQEGIDKLTYSLQSVASTVFNQSFLSGLSGLFDIISGRSSAIPAGRRFVSSTVTGLTVPLSSAMKDVESLTTDPNIPKVENMRQAIIANIPFASQVLKPQLNAFGEPIESIRNRFFSQGSGDPVWKAIADRGWRIPVPNTFFDSPEDQYEYHREQGKMLRKWMEGNLSRLKNLDQKHAQDAIENASDNIRMRVRNKFLSQGVKKKQ